MPNRIERLRQYANPRSKENWQGPGRDQANITRWIERAIEHSDSRFHRAKSGPVELTDTTNMGLPDGAKKIPARFTGNDGSKPYWPNEGPKMRKQAKRDLNHLGSDFEKNVRRSRE
jgi:hypothetical protein